MNARWLPAAILLVLLPAAQAQEYVTTGELQVGLDEMTFDQIVTISGANASRVRQNLDRGVGNGDGMLSRTEVETFERRFSGTYTDDAPNCFTEFTWLRLDGKGPLRVSEMRMDTQGMEGPTSSRAEAKQIFFISFQYPEPAADHVVATMRGDRDSDINFFASVECYVGFSIGAPPDEPSKAPYFMEIGALGKTRILKDSVRPSQALDFWDGDGFRFNVAGSNRFPDEVTFTLAPDTLSPERIATLIGMALGGALGLGALAFLFTEYGRYKLLRLLFLVPGFTRLEKDEVLDHSRREELYQFIKSNPGPSFSDLRRGLELSNGTLVHHLRILESQEYVKGVRDGFRTRFYIRGPKIVPTTYLTRTQQQLLDAIRAHPGMTQKELADAVGLPRQSLFYHTRQLAAQGKLDVRQDGTRRRYWVRT